MNYVDWAKQYYDDALKIESVVSRYEEKLKTSRSSIEKRTLMNRIKSYKLTYRDLRDTGDLLMRRANDISIKNNITIS